jgi:hypothetical protein
VRSIKAGPTKKKAFPPATSVAVTKVMRKAGEEAIAGRYLDLISTHSEGLLADAPRRKEYVQAIRTLMEFSFWCRVWRRAWSLCGGRRSGFCALSGFLEWPLARALLCQIIGHGADCQWPVGEVVR